MTKRRRRTKSRRSPAFPKDIRMPAIKRRKLNRIAFLLMFTCILSAAFHLYPEYKKQTPGYQKPSILKGIIIEEETLLYPLPSTMSKNRSIKVATGAEVIITKQTDGWYQVKTNKGKYWVEKSSLLLEKI